MPLKRFGMQFLSHRYHLMNFNSNDVGKHGAEVFVKAGECFACDGTDSPATFVDVSPGTTMHVLTTGDMLARFHKAYSYASLSVVSLYQACCFSGVWMMVTYIHKCWSGPTIVCVDVSISATKFP